MTAGNTLYITNGDSAVAGLQAAGFKGVFLPIRDALHIGPLDEADDFLSDQSIRCRFIIDQQWASAEKVYQFQQQRREALHRLHEYDSIQLWFEHDLYDQLQLLWVLKFLAEHQIDPDTVKLVVTDLFLGQAYEQDYYELLRFQETASQAHYLSAQKYWAQITGNDPNQWLDMVHNPDALLPFLSSAIHRFCLEFPSTLQGLGLTALQILQCCQQAINPAELFRSVTSKEQAAFMGDSLFFNLVQDLLDAKPSLLRLDSPDKNLLAPGQTIQITAFGRQVLHGEQHFLDNNEVDYWLGGIHIKAGNLWCYNKKEQYFMRRKS